MKPSIETLVPKDKFITQYIVAISTSFAIFSAATGLVWTSPTLPKLLSPDSPIPITLEESSWIVLSSQLGRILTPIPGAWLMDKIGRKKTLLICVFPMVICWTLVLLADSAIYLYFARIFAGCTLGTIYFTVTPMYLGEIASDKVRGSVLVFLPILAKSGFVYMFSIAPFVSISTMAWLLLIPPALFFATFTWCPESPYYLVDKNRRDEAKKSLITLRGHSDVDQELHKIEMAVMKSNEQKGSYRELFAAGNRRSLIIIMVLAFAIESSGVDIVLMYSEVLFREIGNDSMDPVHINIIFGVMGLVTSLLTSYLIERIGRKPLLIGSLIVLAVCSTILAIFIKLQNDNVPIDNLSWIPSVALVVYIIGMGAGVTAIPFVIIGEIFQKHMKGIAGVSFTLALAVIGFGVVNFFQTVSSAAGRHVAFFTFGGCSLFFAPLFWFILPETKGKPLSVILDELNNGKLC